MYTVFSLIKFGMQAFISLAVLGFSMAMIAKEGTQEVHLSILTGIVGYWLPQPSLKYQPPINNKAGQVGDTTQVVIADDMAVDV